HLITGSVLLAVASICGAQTVVRWNFDRTGDEQGWSIPAAVRGVVMGGSLWLTLAPKETDHVKMATTDYQAFGDDTARISDALLASSPQGLGIPAGEVTQVRLRVLNLSSLTDYFLEWRTTEDGWGDAKPTAGWGQPPQSRRCTLKSDSKEWQEITCYI